MGEELLDWVNTVDRAPSTEEGEELADLSRPWEHSNFWPYLYRYGVVSVLSQCPQAHPSATTGASSAPTSSPPRPFSPSSLPPTPPLASNPSPLSL